MSEAPACDAPEPEQPVEGGMDFDFGAIDDDAEGSTVAAAASSLRQRLKQKGILSSPKKLSKTTASLSPKTPKGAGSSGPRSEVPTPASAKKKQKVKGSVKGGRGKRYCKGCGLYFDVELFNVNDPYCPLDRPAVKRLQRTAKMQGKSDRFKDIKGDPQRLQKLLELYHEKVGDEAGGGERLPPWSWAQYEEYEKAEKQTRRRLRGKMMTEDRWIEYAGTIAGGRMNAIRAKQLWDEWLADRDHLRDSLGPGGSVQLYVRTDIEILEDDVYTKGKQVKRGDKQLKDVSDEQLTKMRRRMQTGLDDIGEDTDLVGDSGKVGGNSAVARQLVTSQDGFGGTSMHIGDFDEFASKSMVADAGEEAEDQDDSDQGNGGDDADELASAKASTKAGSKASGPKSFFDRDTKLAVATEKFTKLVDTIESDLKEQATKIDTLMKHELIDHVMIKAWKAKAGVLRTTLTKVLATEGDVEQDLEAHLATFDEKEGTIAASKDGDSGKRSAMGPPCAKYKQLTPVHTWRMMLQELDECQEASDYKQFCADYPKPKAALVDLLNMCKKTATNLQRALKLQEQEAATRKATAAKSGKAAADEAAADAADDGADAGFSILDFMLDAAAKGDDMLTKQLPTAACDTFKFDESGFKLTEPFVISSCERAAALKGTKLMSALSFNETRFMRDPKVDAAKGGAGRGQQAPQNSVLQAELFSTVERVLQSAKEEFVLAPRLATLIDKMPETTKLTPDMKTALTSAFSGNLFGMQKGMPFAGSEKHYLPCLRMAVGGTRKVAIVNLVDLSTALTEVGGTPDGAGLFQLADFKGYFQNLSKQQLGVFLRKFTVWVGTVSPYDLLYVPSGTWVLEDVQPGKDVWGIKMLCMPAKGDPFLSDIASKYAGAPGGHARVGLVQAALDALAAAEST